MAVYFPTDTCELFLPGHHVHGIQWRQSQRAQWRPVVLLSRQGTLCRVRIGGVEETWRFHDEDAALVASWTAGDRAELSGFGLLRLHGGHLNPCRDSDQWQDCRVQGPQRGGDSAGTAAPHEAPGSGRCLCGRGSRRGSGA